MNGNKLKQLVDYCIREGTEFSEHGYWSVSYEELLYHFHVEVSNVNNIGKELESTLKKREEINELIMTEDCIEMTFHMEYCENCEGSPFSLLSVLGCNIYDEHFSSSEESSNKSPIILNAVMERKATEYDFTRCAIDQVIEIGEAEFEAFLRRPLIDYEFIAEYNRAQHDYTGSTRPCLLLLGKEHDDGILINSEGASYARYSAYIPHARQIVSAYDIGQVQNTDEDEEFSQSLSM